jgi:MFS family permease
MIRDRNTAKTPRADLSSRANAGGPPSATLLAMDRSMWAVLGGTFTLRFSTGLTGAMLAVYLAKLPEHGGEEVRASTLALLAAAFYVSELVLSPVFGVISDRVGHHRMMLVGPAFGAVAVVLTGLTTNLPILGGTRLLEGASTAASIPSILGYIALATAGSEILRGKAAARFEAATLAGIGAGFAVAPLLFAAIGPTAFFLNALLYGVSFLIYRFGVEDRDEAERAAAHAAHADQGGAGRVDWKRYGALLRSSHVWLLAPTWIAVNASIGLWFSQSIFQFSKVDPRFPDQALLRGFHPGQISLAAVVIGIIFGAGLVYWGNRFRSLRRTTIILYGIGGGAILVFGGLIVNHAAGLHLVVPLAGVVAMAFGLFVLAGATPAALGLLADMSERFPADRGAIMGLYSVFLAVGQIVGSLIGGVAADLRGIDGLLVATLALLLIALGPLAFLRRQEHQLAIEYPTLAVDVDEAEPGHS